MKPHMSIVLGIGRPGDKHSAGSMRSSRSSASKTDDPKSEAAADVISAVKAGDADALSVALEDFIRACEGSDYEDDDKPEEGE